MSKVLSPEQVMLLENLTYLNMDNVKSGESLTEFLSSIDMSSVGDNLTTRDEWQTLINAVKADPELQHITIASTNTDWGTSGSGGGFSALFINEDTGEGIVAYRGTAADEWADDFEGGGPMNTADGVSTPQQENALNWYQKVTKEHDLTSITVTGHSKGGNKAKYVTVMDNSVDRCISMDGQGFSDEFMNKYRDRIAGNEAKIRNYNSKDDYVNILLNDIGGKTYYEPHNINGQLVQNHCPNAMFEFKSDGTISMQEAQQSEEMQEFDRFLNSYLRTLSPEDKQATLSLIGSMAQEGLGHGNKDFGTYLDILSGNPAVAASLLAYLYKYEQINPEFGKAITGLLKRYGTELPDWFNPIKQLFENGIADDLLRLFADSLNNRLSASMLSALLKKMYGIDLSADYVMMLARILISASHMSDKIDARKNGDDIVIPEAAPAKTDDLVQGDPSGNSVNNGEAGNIVSSGPTWFDVDTGKIYSASGRLSDLASVLNSLNGQISQVRADLNNLELGAGIDMDLILNLTQHHMTTSYRNVEQLSTILACVARQYEAAENAVQAKG